MTRDDLRLRPVRDEDLPVFFVHQADPVASTMAAFPSRDRPAFDAHWARTRADASVILRTILCGTDVAGNVVSWLGEGRRWVGYWVGREFWGRGVATRALGMLLDEVAERPLFADVAPTNSASIRVLERAGFARVSEDAASRVYRLE